MTSTWRRLGGLACAVSLVAAVASPAAANKTYAPALVISGDRTGYATFTLDRATTFDYPHAQIVRTGAYAAAVIEDTEVLLSTRDVPPARGEGVRGGQHALPAGTYRVYLITPEGAEAKVVIQWTAVLGKSLRVETPADHEFQIRRIPSLDTWSPRIVLPQHPVGSYDRIWGSAEYVSGQDRDVRQSRVVETCLTRYDVCDRRAVTTVQVHDHGANSGQVVYIRSADLHGMKSVAMVHAPIKQAGDPARDSFEAWSLWLSLDGYRLPICMSDRCFTDDGARRLTFS